MVSLAPLLDQVAIIATSFFCGAATYVTLVEQPARMQVPVREAARQFGKSYPRAAILQPVYILITCTASAARYFSASLPVVLHKRSEAIQQAHLINLLLMSGCGIWTAITMLSGNKALLAAEQEPIPRVKQLLQTWGWKHSIRTVASAVAVVVLVTATVGTSD